MATSTMLKSITRVYSNTSPPTLQLRGASPEPLDCDGLSVTPVIDAGNSVFGAEVSGVDWSQPVPAETVQKVL